MLSRVARIPLQRQQPASREVVTLMESQGFLDAVSELATSLGRSTEQILREAEEYLREMSAWHDPRYTDHWHRFSAWMSRCYDVLVDDDALSELRKLDRKHSLVLLISHRSYLDEFVIPPALNDGGITQVYGMAGANLDFFPLGTVARRVGMVHVRRATSDAPVYRFALRWFIGELVRNKANLLWSIEGGRSRTGKLRPPRFGLLRYVADAVESTSGAETLLVPVSIMYDQLPVDEVARMASEARGVEKKPEDVRWFVDYIRGLRSRLGRAYLDFGEPLPLGKRLAELRAEDVPEQILVERAALDICHRLNEATPVTPTAAVCVALLGAGRALSLDQVLTTVSPLARYLELRQRPIAGAANLTDRSTIRWALRELVRSKVLTCYAGGTEQVWGLGQDQHLIAAVYRNSAIHVLVERAIAELALLAVADSEGTPERHGSHNEGAQIIQTEALRLRELLKFDFFFAQRDQFLEEINQEVGILANFEVTEAIHIQPVQARTWLARSRPLVAHLLLRPFLDAYRLVGEQLATTDEAQNIEPDTVVRDCLRIGHQWAMQHTLASEESVSGEMFRTALKLAAHRNLLSASNPQVGTHRLAFADELREISLNIARLADIAQKNAGRY